MKQQLSKIFLCLLVVICMFQRSTVAFVVPQTKLLSSNNPYSGILGSHPQYQTLRPTTALRASDKNVTDTKFSLESYIEVGEPRILLLDLVTIAIACELMGLVDLLNDPRFWNNGGWMQPIPLEPSTMDVLIQRFSGLSVSWLLAGSMWRGFRQESISTDESLIRTTGSICVTFVILRLGLAFLVATIGADSVDTLDLVKQFYFAVLLLCTGRVIYSKYNR